MKLRVRSLLGGCAMALIVVSGGPGPALASHEPPRLGLTPVGASAAYFDLTLESGEAASLQVELANFGHANTLARTYAADAYSIVNGGFGAELFGEPASDTTRWLTYETREALLEPRDAIVLDLRVEVPDDTAPGEYIAALVAENVDPYRDGDKSVVLDQVNRVAVAVAIEVPGPSRPSLAIGAVSHDVSAGTSFVSFEVENQGNVHLKPTGDFAVRDANGNEMVAAAAVMDTLYAGSATRLEVPLATALSLGTYCGELALRDDATGASAKTECLPFSVESAATAGEAEGQGAGIPGVQATIDAIGTPAIAALAGVALLAVVVASGAVERRRRRRTDQGMNLSVK